MERICLCTIYTSSVYSAPYIPNWVHSTFTQANRYSTLHEMPLPILKRVPVPFVHANLRYARVPAYFLYRWQARIQKPVLVPHCATAKCDFTRQDQVYTQMLEIVKGGKFGNGYIGKLLFLQAVPIHFCQLTIMRPFGKVWKVVYHRKY